MSEDGLPSAAARSDTFGQTIRQIWIDAVLAEDGELSRADICHAFGVSIPQASHDIRRFLSRAPARMAYDRSSKIYRAIEGTWARYGADQHKAAFAAVSAYRAAIKKERN